jgi:hypothetical protein
MNKGSGNSKTYGWLRRQLSSAQTGSKNHMFGVRVFGKVNPNFGRKWSEEKKQAMSALKKGCRDSSETKAKKSKSKSATHRANIAKSKLGNINGFKRKVA